MERLTAKGQIGSKGGAGTGTGQSVSESIP